MLSLPLRTPGIVLITFYLLGSSATRTGQPRKATLEDGHDHALAATALLHRCSPTRPAHLLQLLPGGHCMPQGSLESELQKHFWRTRALLFIVLGCVFHLLPLFSSTSHTLIGSHRHFACCMGDTLASELGILSSSPPILLTTLKTVPPGTNGALSLLGTAASVGGGMAMGWTMWAALSVENASCRDQTGDLFLLLLGWGAIAGGLGSLLDSLLGATLQRTQYSNTSKRILTDTSTVPQDDSDIKVVSGLDVLTNNHVNLISSTLTALALGYLA
ncbi:integral membrane protein DUF92-domain-containing protein [Russula vinacea]|nr:integral membrane protein DUF92-domain-containing protein [Russula vinacea]